MKTRSLLSFIAFVLVATNLNAALIEGDLYSGSDDGYLTVNTDYGIEFLDLSLTSGFSPNDILGGAMGYLDMGFRYANRQEVAQLYSASGSYLDEGGYYAENYDEANLLLDRLGVLCCVADGFESSLGIYREAGVWAFGSFSANHDKDTAQMRHYLGYVGPDFSSSHWGHFLVRDRVSQVTEPATALLLFTGALALLIGRRRKVSS
ncbi:PEP-CTERM sorting domain-containing protein [Marinobacter sp. 1Y8]